MITFMMSVGFLFGFFVAFGICRIVVYPLIGGMLS